jgi:hypothetical protein
VTTTTSPAPRAVKRSRVRRATRVILAARAAVSRGRLVIHGRVAHARNGRVTLRLQRWSWRRHRWTRTLVVAARVHRGRFAVRIAHGVAGRWRARAAYSGSREVLAAISHFRAFRLA